jgi:Mor family transcriptional regulator
MNNNMEEIKEKIELVKDRLENINATLSMPFPDKLHVQALRELVPELIEDMTEIIQEFKK